MHPPFTEGERVSLLGTLDAAGPLCPCFEDARAAVAITTASGDEAGNVTARAERLSIMVDGREVALKGPVRVLKGSLETRPGAALAALDAGVVRRMTEASGDAALPQGKIRFRALRPGDRVRAEGVMARAAADGAAIAYREDAAPWALTPDPAVDTPAISLAFDGSPRVRGPLASMLRGVRSARRAVMAAVGFALVLAIAVGLSRVTPRSLAASPARAKPAPRVGHKRCAEIADGYAKERDRANHCERDEECAVELRGEKWSALDGCFRFKHKSAPTAAADAIADTWLEGGCAQEFNLCSEVPQTMCREGRCVEHPRPPIPEDWVRQDALHIFSMFLPKGMNLAYPPHEDALIYIVAQDNGIHLRIMYEPAYQDYDRVNDAELGAYQRVMLHGIEARIRRGPSRDVVPEKEGYQIDVYITDLPACPSIHCIADKNYFRMHIDCPDRATCDRMMLAVNSLEFY